MKKPETTFYEELDHTADIGIRVRGTSLEELFEHAAFAMFDLILAKYAIVGVESVELITADGDSPEALLREWLAELLYMHLVGKVMLRQIRVLTITDNNITAEVTHCSFSDTMIAEGTEIKAVTWHGLCIQTDQDGLQAQVIFDT